MHVRMLWFCRYLSEMVMSLFTVRRYVSAVLAMAPVLVGLSLCPSQVGRSVKTD